MLMVNSANKVVIIMSKTVQSIIIGYKKIIPPKDKQEFMKLAKEQTYILGWEIYNQELTNMGVVRLAEYQDPNQNQN